MNDVVVNGENGWQYETFEEFSSYLTQLLDDELRYKMGENARRHMVAHYSAAAFASRVLEIYQEVLDSYVPEENDSK